MASGMADLLCCINDKRKAHISKGTFFTEDEILASGRNENRSTKRKYAKQEEKALLTRLEKYKKNHLLFLYDFSVPFENNMSERDLRKCKNRQKIAGGFRKNTGNDMYCRIMSVIETLKRKNMQVMENLIKIFEGTPAF